jgi:hypothetical protein
MTRSESLFAGEGEDFFLNSPRKPGGKIVIYSRGLRQNESVGPGNSVRPDPRQGGWRFASNKDEPLTGSGIQAVPAQALRIGPQHTQRDEPLSAAAIQVSVCFEELRGAISGYIVTLCRRP